jgi:hypothetical protein
LEQFLHSFSENKDDQSSSAVRRRVRDSDLWNRMLKMRQTERDSPVVHSLRNHEVQHLMAKKKTTAVPPKLTEAEQDMLTHLEQGYELETDSLGSNPVLRRLKDSELIRPLSANRNTIKALEERGLIRSGKGRDALTIAWRLAKKR